ncbi:hypothetical protein [Marinifilum sp.]|uniref:hypothetical protein n=1 Tax=Marinifilum sp. TaxID=2033137 RepID=UPI003BA95A8D
MRKYIEEIGILERMNSCGSGGVKVVEYADKFLFGESLFLCPEIKYFWHNLCYVCFIEKSKTT